MRDSNWGSDASRAFDAHRGPPPSYDAGDQRGSEEEDHHEMILPHTTTTTTTTYNHHHNNNRHEPCGTFPDGSSRGLIFIQHAPRGTLPGGCGQGASNRTTLHGPCVISGYEPCGTFPDRSSRGRTYSHHAPCGTLPGGCGQGPCTTTDTYGPCGITGNCNLLYCAPRGTLPSGSGSGANGSHYTTNHIHVWHDTHAQHDWTNGVRIGEASHPGPWKLNGGLWIQVGEAAQTAGTTLGPPPPAIQQQPPAGDSEEQFRFESRNIRGLAQKLHTLLGTNVDLYALQETDVTE